MAFLSTLRWEPREESHSRLHLNLEFRLEAEESWGDGVKWWFVRGPNREEIPAARALKLARKIGAEDEVAALIREGAERARRAHAKAEERMQDELAAQVKSVAQAAGVRQRAEEQVAILLEGRDA